MKLQSNTGKNPLRRARLTGSLTAKERKGAAAARVPSEAAQKRYLSKLAKAMWSYIRRSKLCKASPAGKVRL